MGNGGPGRDALRQQGCQRFAPRGLDGLPEDLRSFIRIRMFSGEAFYLMFSMFLSTFASMFTSMFGSMFMLREHGQSIAVRVSV